MTRKSKANNLTKIVEINESTNTEEGQNENLLCRICLDPDVKSELISPCDCSGSIKYVHHSCLVEWITKAKNKRSTVECSMCKGKYTFRRVSIKSPLKKKRMLIISALKEIIFPLLVFPFILSFLGYAYLGCTSNEATFLSINSFMQGFRMYYGVFGFGFFLYVFTRSEILFLNFLNFQFLSDRECDFIIELCILFGLFVSVKFIKEHYNKFYKSNKEIIDYLFYRNWVVVDKNTID